MCTCGQILWSSQQSAELLPSLGPGVLSVDLGVRMWSNMPGDVGFMCLQARLSGLSH